MLRDISSEFSSGYNVPPYLLLVSALLLLIVVILFLVSKLRKSRPMNWYEQNLLEIASSPPNYVRCRAFTRVDTEDEQKEVAPSSTTKISPSIQHQPSITRQQSRIKEITSYNFEVNKPVGDLSGIFVVPRMTKTVNSMFDRVDQRQIDRGLYQTSMDVESHYNDETHTSGCCGSIKLGISADQNLSLLIVSLKQAVDLVAKRHDECPNAYFKVALDIPESSMPKVAQQSKVIRTTSSPLVDEDFYFQIPSFELLSQCRLEIMVYDSSQFSVDDDCIGYCWLTLGRLSLPQSPPSSPQKCPAPIVFWAEVLPFDDDNGRGYGEVLISLVYLSKAQRLSVNIFKARNLNIDGVDNTTCSAIRATLVSAAGGTFERRKHKRKRTASRKQSCHPQFNESLTFQIQKTSLCDTILEMEALQECGAFGMSSRVVGRIKLPLHKCRDLWRAIIHEEKSQARWYTLEEP